MAADRSAIEKMPNGYDFSTAAAIPLSGMTSYHAITEELKAKTGDTVFIPEGPGSLGQMAVQTAKSPGLHAVVSGTAPDKEFAVLNYFPPFKRLLFVTAGAKYDKAAKKYGKK